LLYFSLAAAILCACSVGQDDRTPDVFDKVRALDLLPRSPIQGGDANSNSSKPRQAAVYAGGQVVEVDAQVQESPSGDGYELNFENTPITTVAKVILSDILGVGYTIDPRVQGTITLASGRPVPKSDVLYVLETALRINGVALVRDTAGYRLVPAGEAVGSGNLDRGTAARMTEPGYGISVVPLQYVSAQTLIKLLDSFATKAGTLRADPSRNLLIIQGSGAERRAAIEIVLNFDKDWMRGQSVGIYPVRNSTPEPLLTELEKILDTGEGGVSQNLVKLQAIGRLNAILVVTRKPELLKTVATWITRLDNSDSTSTGVKVYRVRYGDARQMSRLLNEIFVGGSSSSLDSATNQIAPGSGSVSMSSGDRSATGGAASGAPRLLPPVADAGRSTAPSADVSSATTRSAGAGGSSLLPGVRITADVVNNTLLIYANQESYVLIERTLRQLDRPQLQVAIDATIAEVTLNNNLAYGVQFFLKSSDIGLRPDQGSILNSVGGAVLSRALPGFNLLVGSEAEPRLILDALHNVTDVKVLSNPSLVVLDNQVATLQVGDQIPVTTGTATVLTANNQIVSSIDYRNTGIILRVVPRINFNGNVMLDIEQEISNVADASSTGTLTPTVSQRKVKSSIAVASGQTVLLAGLISERRNSGRAGIPLLDQLPGIGDAFSHQQTTSQRTELIIFIRPQIIRDSVDAHYVAEELRSKLATQPQTVSPSPSLLPMSAPVVR
jgi:general secretion pathway protein D